METETDANHEEPELRIPDVPSLPNIPQAPELKPVLPPRPSKAMPMQTTQSQSVGKAALASMAATSFIMPIIILALGGYWLDTRLKHSTFWFAGLGVLVGMAVGINSLMRLLERLNNEK